MGLTTMEKGKNVEIQCGILNILEIFQKQATSEENVCNINYFPTESIIKQNVHTTHFTLFREGIAKLVLEGEKSKSIILDFCVDCDILSYPFDNQYNQFTVIALTECKVTMIEKKYFNKLLTQNKDLKKILIEYILQNNNKLHKKLLKYATQQMHGRLAEGIIYLNQELMKEKQIFNYLTRKDLADFTGMSVESMVRLLTEFKNDKIVNISGKNVEINNLELLQRLVQIG